MATDWADELAAQIVERIDGYIDYARVKQVMARPFDPCGPMKGIPQGFMEDRIAAIIRAAAPKPAEAERLPWNQNRLANWDIVGMNHYHIEGERRLFVAMTNGVHCIRAEGMDEAEVFAVLSLTADALAAQVPEPGERSHDSKA